VELSVKPCLRSPLRGGDLAPNLKWLFPFDLVLSRGKERPLGVKVRSEQVMPFEKSLGRFRRLKASPTGLAVPVSAPRHRGEVDP
jgi:hypothetical protein